MRRKYTLAVHLFFLRDDQVLLIRRFNTGYEDGNFSVVAGHVDAGQPVIRATIREASKEAGMTREPANLQIVHVMNRKSEADRIDFFITVRHWIGEIVNNKTYNFDQFLWANLNR